MRKFKFIICDMCEGFGKVDNPAFSQGFTSSEWSDLEQEQRDTYLSGSYDVTCSCCKGSGKVQVPNMEVLTFAEKRQLARDRREARLDAEFAKQSAYERSIGY